MDVVGLFIPQLLLFSTLLGQQLMVLLGGSLGDGERSEKEKERYKGIYEFSERRWSMEIR